MQKLKFNGKFHILTSLASKIQFHQYFQLKELEWHVMVQSLIAAQICVAVWQRTVKSYLKVFKILQCQLNLLSATKKKPTTDLTYQIILQPRFRVVNNLQNLLNSRSCTLELISLALIHLHHQHGSIQKLRIHLVVGVPPKMTHVEILILTKAYAVVNSHRVFS